jgi:3-isopropylmalate dehydrogenase
MILGYDLARPEAALLIETVVQAVLDQGLRTADIKQEGDGCQLVGCVYSYSFVVCTDPTVVV